jgi:hypothetical protein
MNDDAAPLQPDELDELLSADLDGELAAAARELGSDADSIRARIAATPDAAVRRAALTAARDALAEPPGLDEFVAARLRGKAVRAAETRSDARESTRRERRNRLLLTASGIAAAILVIAGVAVAVGRSGSSGKSGSAAGKAGTPATGLSPSIDLSRSVPALGSYDDVAALGSVAVNAAQRRAVELLPAAPASGVAPNSTPASLERPASNPVPSGGAGASASSRTDDSSSRARSGQAASTSSKSSKQIFGAASAPCTPAKYAGAGEQLLMHASATLDGRPVDVYVFSGPDVHTVVVLSPRCGLVNVQTLA